MFKMDGFIRYCYETYNKLIIRHYSPPIQVIQDECLIRCIILLFKIFNLVNFFRFFRIQIVLSIIIFTFNATYYYCKEYCGKKKAIYY